MEGGMISVDRWARGSQAYFLTHLHSDHTRGLSSTWSHGPLFCSRTTAKLFPLKFPDFNFALLRVVEIGSWHHLSLSSPSSGSPAPIQFMPIDAFHCPGAVMFLFKGIFGHVLYTGDFRWEATGERSMKARNMLLDALHGAKVDHLYLDNTYCNPLYCFPTREVAAQQTLHSNPWSYGFILFMKEFRGHPLVPIRFTVIEIIASHPDHDIIIGIDSLGKEDLLLQISRSLKIKIWVWPERLQTMHLLGYPDIFTTRTSLTRVRAVPRYSFSINTLEAFNAKRPTIGIMPSGLPWVVKPFEGKMKDSLSLSVASTNRTLASNGTRVDRNMKSAEKVHNHIFTVPYSDHCCFCEIKDFVQLTKPYNVKGIVSMSSCYVNPAYYLSHLFSSNHSSQKTRLDPEIHMEVEKVERKGKMKIRDIRGTGMKKRTNKANFLGVRICRVAILRQISRGVKIVECDSPD